MRVLVIGSDSAIGGALTSALEDRGDNVVGTTRRPDRVGPRTILLDLASQDIVETRLPFTDVAFFCAAVSRAAECRAHPDRARQVNVNSPSILARRLVAAGMRVILLSTNAVYDGSRPLVPEACPAAPRTVYGAMKVDIEREFLSAGAPAAILRMTKVLTPSFTLIVNWISELTNRRNVTAFFDLVFAPVALNDVVVALLAIADQKGTGIFQISATRDISYCDAARHLARHIGVAPSLVRSVSAKDHGIPMEQIAPFTSLDSSRLAALVGVAPRDPLQALERAYGAAITKARISLLDAG